jgi:ferredoxin
MAQYSIKFEQKDCIGCGACTSQCPENWEMVEKSGEYKAKVKKMIINEDEYDSNQEAADICPVECIKLEKMKEKAGFAQEIDEI